MKKIFSPIMATAFALMLTNCSNNDIVTEQPVQPTAKQISLKADIVGSKLSMSDDYKMTWDAGDKIGVYISKIVGTDTTYNIYKNEPFTYNAATKTFTGNVELEDATSYEWAAVYPYTTGASSYLWNKASLFTSSNMTTKQVGTREDLLNFDIMASNVVTKLGSESVHLTMAHQTSIIKINVKNGSEETITPSSLNFDVGQTISGRTVYYDFGAGDVVGNPTSKKDYVTLSLSDNTPIAKDAQFTAYFMVLPFSAAAGSKINVTLNDVYVCEKTMPSIFSFDAGSYYETTVTVKQPDAISVTPESLSWAADATDAKIVTVTSSGAWTASIDNTADFTLTPTSGANGDTFTVTPKEANTGATAKTATVTLTCGTATATVTCSQAAAGAAGEIEYVFGEHADFATWGSSYANHSLTYPDITANFTKYDRQTGTITDCPVTKGGEMVVILNDTSKSIGSVSFVLKQWSTKTQTVELWYSTDGTNYTTTGVTSSTFSIPTTTLPANTIAVKLTFSSSSNQVGVYSCSMTIN